MDPLTVKRDFIHEAMERARAGRYPVIEPLPEDNSRDLSWWLPVFDAKAFLFSENGSATWLFPHYRLKVKPIRRVVVSFAGVTLVDSDKCLEFQETAHEAQIYIPPSEVDFRYLVESDTLTYCPFKNIARYYSVRVGGQEVQDAFWCYQDIYDFHRGENADGVLAIRGMLSPYRSKLKVEL